MVLTAIEFLGLAFFLGVVAGAVLEQLARPRVKPITPNNSDPDQTFEKWLKRNQWRPFDGMTPAVMMSYIVHMQNCWNAAIDAGDMALHLDNPMVLRADRMRRLKVGGMANFPINIPASVPTVELVPEDDSPTCSLCGAAMKPTGHDHASIKYAPDGDRLGVARGYKCTSCGRETSCS